MTVEERRQREREQRRENIISVASKLFSTKGYDKVSMEEIALEAELSKSTLYFYFEDKESIFFAVISYGTKLYRAIVIEEEERKQTAGIKVMALNTARVRFLFEYPDYFTNYLYLRSGRFDLSEEKSLNADVKDVLKFAKEAFEKSVLEIKASIEERTLRSDMNPVVTTVLCYLIFGISTRDPILNEILKIHGFTMQQIQLEVLDLLQLLMSNITG